MGRRSLLSYCSQSPEGDPGALVWLLFRPSLLWHRACEIWVFKTFWNDISDNPTWRPFHLPFVWILKHMIIAFQPLFKSVSLYGDTTESFRSWTKNPVNLTDSTECHRCSSQTKMASAGIGHWPGCCCRRACCPCLCPSPCPCFRVCACACVCACASSSSSCARGGGGDGGGRGRRRVWMTTKSSLWKTRAPAWRAWRAWTAPLTAALYLKRGKE